MEAWDNRRTHFCETLAPDWCEIMGVDHWGILTACAISVFLNDKIMWRYLYASNDKFSIARLVSLYLFLPKGFLNFLKFTAIMFNLTSKLSLQLLFQHLSVKIKTNIQNSSNQIKNLEGKEMYISICVLGWFSILPRIHTSECVTGQKLYEKLNPSWAGPGALWTN